jgi:Fe-S-cluster-containing dehydrogenase component
MSDLNGIIKDLDLCVGCYACEVACKQENNVPIGTKWVRVIPVGPEKINNNLRMDFLSEMTDKCTCCDHRLKENLLPRCVDNCPMGALRFCKDSTEILIALRSGRRIQPCKVKGEVPFFV